MGKIWFNSNTESGQIVKALMEMSGTTAIDIAKEFDISRAAVYTSFKTNMTLGKFIKYCEFMGFQIDIKRANGAGTVNIIDYDPCEKCGFKEFTYAIEDAMAKLRAYKNEDDETVLGEYDDGIENGETE